jgi:hypothetical protein
MLFEISRLDWVAELGCPARSFVHDHNRWERTTVHRGKIIETRYDAESGARTERTYSEGESFWVSAGTIHEVRCEEGHAITYNFVFGRLLLISA